MKKIVGQKVKDKDKIIDELDKELEQDSILIKNNGTDEKSVKQKTEEDTNSSDKLYDLK